jgi:N-acylneuraminate cytidylyltransferase/CMP-N,N'-diacetyllegionaminic acid synthase
MYKGKRILAIIPARGGSKGLPGKNIKEMCGKPLIAWSIEHAQKSKYVDEIFISTDSQEIADVAEKYGAPCPELRPAELARDTAPSSEFIVYTLEKMKKEGKPFDYFILLEPTSPLRDVEDVDKSIEMLIDSPVSESCVGVAMSGTVHPAFMVVVGEDGYLKALEPDKQTLRRQDLPDVFFFEGSVYVSEVEAYLKKRTFYHDKTLPYIVPEWKSHEVDDFVDFTIIEAIMKLKLNGYFNK